MGRRPLQALLSLLAVAAVVGIVLLGRGQAPHVRAGVGAVPDLASARARLAGSPPALAALHAAAGTLRGSGLTAVRSELAAVHGFPAVVNFWGSWCAPCRQEFGTFARVAVRLGRGVAFLGVDTDDSRAGASAFLAGHPVSYPSVFDAHGQAVAALTHAVGLPVSAFFGSDGRLRFVHQGLFLSDGDLERAVRLYAEGA